MATLSITRAKTLPDSSAKADFHDLVDTATAAISNIVNADIGAAAAIASTKLNLASIAQSIMMTNSGNNNVLSVTNAGTANGLVINQSGALASNKEGLIVYTDTAQTTGYSLLCISNSNASTSIPIVRIDNNGTGYAEEIDNNGTGCGLFIHQDGVLDAGKNALYVTSAAKQDGVNSHLINFSLTNASSSTNILTIGNDGTGDGICVNQVGNAYAAIEVNNDGTNHGLYIHQDGALVSGQHGLYVYSNTVQESDYLVDFTQAQITSSGGLFRAWNYGDGHGIHISQDGVLAASKYGLYVYSNAIQTTSALAYILQDNASSSKPALEIKFDPTVSDSISAIKLTGCHIANGSANVSISNLAPAGVGTATIGAWLPVDIAGTMYYIPMWT